MIMMYDVYKIPYRVKRYLLVKYREKVYTERERQREMSSYTTYTEDRGRKKGYYI